MHYSQSLPLVEKEWRTAEETSSDGPARDLDGRSDLRIGIRPMKPSIRSPRPSGNAARDMVVARAPLLGWLFSVSSTKSPAVAATAPEPVQQLEP